MTAPNDVAALVERLVKIADAARREDGSDIPLGQDVRLAAATIAALQAEVERAKEDDGWQPIETAPKGGKFGCFLMLAFGPEGDQTVSEGMHFDGRFYAASIFYTGGPHDTRQFAFREHEVHPTHWRPTLAAPRSASRKENTP